MTAKKANKAALFSAIIFPGAGLWWLKHYGRASIFIVAAIGSLGYIITTLYNSIMPIYSKMLRDAEEGLIVVDASNFSSMFTKLYQEMYQGVAAHQSQLNAAQCIFIACWLCSIASSYFVGKKMDLAESTAKESNNKSNTKPNA
jgi:hypothetical protein